MFKTPEWPCEKPTLSGVWLDKNGYFYNHKPPKKQFIIVYIPIPYYLTTFDAFDIANFARFSTFFKCRKQRSAHNKYRTPLPVKFIFSGNVHKLYTWVLVVIFCLFLILKDVFVLTTFENFNKILSGGWGLAVYQT